MAETTFILLLTLGFASLGHCLDTYTYVGTYQLKDYYIGQNVSERGLIYQKCQEKFGKGAYTLNIKDAGEWDYLKAQLSANHGCTGCTRNFWTNGKYDRTINAGQGVVITVTNNVVGTKIDQNTVEHKYICQTPTTTTRAPIYEPSPQDPPANPSPVVECRNENDVIVILDSSGSIGQENYLKEKLFAYDIARVFGNQETSRFGFTIFSSSILRKVALSNGLTSAEINSKVINAEYMGYQTYTNLPIDDAVAQFDDSNRNVPKNLIIITDGASTDPAATINSITAAKNKGIRSYSVGIGPATSSSELLKLAGGISSRMFTAKNFDELTSLVNPLRSVVC